MTIIQIVYGLGTSDVGALMTYGRRRIGGLIGTCICTWGAYWHLHMHMGGLLALAYAHGGLIGTCICTWGAYWHFKCTCTWGAYWHLHLQKGGAAGICTRLSGACRQLHARMGAQVQVGVLHVHDHGNRLALRAAGIPRGRADDAPEPDRNRCDSRCDLLNVPCSFGSLLRGC